MHVLLLHVEGLPAPLQLHYEDAQSGQRVLETIRAAQANTTIDIEDHWGHGVSVPRSRLLVPQLIDVARDIELKFQMQMEEAMANQRFHQLIQSTDQATTPQLGQQVRPK